jgi:hypothetical protein
MRDKGREVILVGGINGGADQAAGGRVAWIGSIHHTDLIVAIDIAEVRHLVHINPETCTEKETERVKEREKRDQNSSSSR